MKKNILFLLLLAATTSATAAYNGRVFVDKNSNGQFDRGEKTLGGIKVSDGLNVTETAKDGTYTLPGHARQRFIFITTPSGYKTLNKHYHKIDSRTNGYDFGLLTYHPGIGKDGSHQYVHVSDTEIFNTEGNEAWVRNIREYAANENAAFIIHTGDICYENGMKKHIKLMNTENMNVPVFYCIGNHDLVKGKYGEEVFENNYGPVYYSFDVANVHYIVTPMPGGDHKPGYTRLDVCRWLKNDLAHIKPGTPIVVFNHDILTYGDEFIYKGSETESIDLNKHNLKAWVYGHWHINHVKKQGSVYTVCTSALDKGGIIFTDRATVDKVEKMKVCTCLNPLHTALAIYGCLLGYTLISEEMKNPLLKNMVEVIGYKEGLPVVVNPGILDPKKFIDEVVNVRIPNPFLPDSPQRIATDTSQKLSIRFGETIKAYEASPDLHTEDLKLIPLVYAGWLRYLMGIDDEGREFTPSSDPLLEEVRQYVADYELSFSPKDLSKLDALLANEKIFGVNLHAIGMDTLVKQYFAELSSGVGAVAAALKKYVPEKVTL